MERISSLILCRVSGLQQARLGHLRPIPSPDTAYRLEPGLVLGPVLDWRPLCPEHSRFYLLQLPTHGQSFPTVSAHEHEAVHWLDHL